MTRTSLNSSELKRFSDQLQAQEKQLRATIRDGLLNSRDQSLADLAGRVQDSGEESVADMLTDVNIKQLSNAVQALSDVEAAKRRLRDATYGVCIDCGASVATARLQAYPTAKRCITCQTRHENQRGGRDSTPSL